MWDFILKILGLKRYSEEEAFEIARVYFLTLGSYNKKRKTDELRDFLQDNMTKKQIHQETYDAYVSYFTRYSLQEAYEIAITYIYKLDKIKKKAKKEKMYEFLREEMKLSEIQQACNYAYENYFKDNGSFLGQLYNGAVKVVGGVVGGVRSTVGSIITIGLIADNIATKVDNIKKTFSD